MGTPVERSQTSALTGQESWWDRMKRVGSIAGVTAIGGPLVGVAYADQFAPWHNYESAPDKYNGITGVPSFSPTTGFPEVIDQIPPVGTTPSTPASAPGDTAAPGSSWSASDQVIADPYKEFLEGMKNQGTATGIANIAADQYQQYLDEMNSRWEMQQADIQAQYQPNIDRAQQQVDDLQRRLGLSNKAYADFEAGMAGIDKEIPYGAIADPDATRIARHYDEAEGRLAKALNVMPDDLSDTVVSDLRYLEGVTTSALMDDLENTEKLHELGGIYAQAIADEAYSASTLEGQRAKLEMQAQFDKAIDDAKEEVKRLKRQMADAVARSRSNFDFNYPDFEANRESVTKAAFEEWARQNGVSSEDASQAWTMYENIYADHAGQIASQSDFDGFMRQEINDVNFQLISTGIFSKLNNLWRSDPADIDQSTTAGQVRYQQAMAAQQALDWLNRNDLAAAFEGGSSMIELQKSLLYAGIDSASVQQFLARGRDLASANAFTTYDSHEAETARHAYQITKITDEHWEQIYYGMMTIPVDSRYVYRDKNSGAVFPIGGPEIWHSSNAGYHYLKPAGYYHDAADFHSQRGTPVLSVLPGQIVKNGWNPISGNYVVVQHSNGRQTKYMHLEDRSPFPVGEKVDGGTSIGRVGNTGNASGTGYHLHFEYLINGTKHNPKELFNYADHPYGTRAPSNNKRGDYRWTFDLMGLFS